MTKTILFLLAIGLLAATQAAGQGFAPTATTWALPTGGSLYNGTDYGFNGPSSTDAGMESDGSQNWTLEDLNGDAKLDLVVTSQRVSGTALPFGTIPNRTWRVYLNQATALATAAPASLVADVSLYPNPATGQLTLRGPSSLAGQPYALLDALGRTVRAGQLGAAEPTLDVQALPTGVYGVRVGSDGHLLRFVKQ